MLPDHGLIGAEPYVNGVAQCLAQIEEERLANIRLVHGDECMVVGHSLVRMVVARVDRPAIAASVAPCAADAVRERRHPDDEIGDPTFRDPSLYASTITRVRESEL